MLSRESESVSDIGGDSCCDGVGEEVGRGKGRFTKLALSPMVTLGKSAASDLAITAAEDSSKKAVVLGPIKARAVPVASSAEVSAPRAAAMVTWASSTAKFKSATAVARKASTKAGPFESTGDVCAGEELGCNDAMLGSGLEECGDVGVKPESSAGSCGITVGLCGANMYALVLSSPCCPPCSLLASCREALPTAS